MDSTPHMRDYVKNCLRIKEQFGANNLPLYRRVQYVILYNFQINHKAKIILD